MWKSGLYFGRGKTVWVSIFGSPVFCLPKSDVLESVGEVALAFHSDLPIVRDELVFQENVDCGEFRHF